MSLEGRLRVDLEITANAVLPTIQSERPLHAARLFEGRAVDEVPGQLPLLFNLCGKAHGVASVCAIEAAQGHTANSATWTRREALVLAESLREHLVRVALDWPRLLDGSSSDTDATGLNRHCQVLIEQIHPADCLSPGVDCPALQHACATILDQIDKGIRERILGMTPEAFLAFGDIASFRDWMATAQTATAALLRELAHCPLCQGDGGEAETPFLPEDIQPGLAKVLAGDRWLEFAAAPHWQGACRQTGAQVVYRQHPLILALNKESNGDATLLWRFTVRLLAICDLLITLRALLDEEGAGGAAVVRKVFRTQLATPAESGAAGHLCRVETARGGLHHYVECREGVIYRYRILAPTEWNFHPQGIAWWLLSRIPSAAADRVRLTAARVIQAVDPCVGYEIRIDGSPLTEVGGRA